MVTAVSSIKSKGRGNTCSVSVFALGGEGTRKGEKGGVCGENCHISIFIRVFSGDSSKGLNVA